MKARTAKMTGTVKLLGTTMALWKGEMVRVIPASNIPGYKEKGLYYARPFRGMWNDGIQRNTDDSILIDASQIEFPKKPNRIL